MKKVFKGLLVVGLVGLIGCDDNPAGPSAPVAPPDSGGSVVNKETTGKKKKTMGGASISAESAAQ